MNARPRNTKNSVAAKKPAAAKRAVAAQTSPAVARAEGPRSPLRVMQTLQELAGSAEGLPLARLSERLAAPKTSLLSLLRSLEAGGYVRLSNRLYHLGPSAARLGVAIAARAAPDASLSHRMRPFLVELVERTGETALLGVLADDRRHGVYIDIAEGRGVIRFTSVLGTHRPLFCSAFGKTLLAFLDRQEAMAYLAATPLVLPHGNRRLARSGVLAELARIRSTRLSISHEEIVEGAGGLASPVFDRDARVVCVLAVAAPIGRLRTHESQWFDVVRDAAARASASMGFTGRYLGS
jgi:DNA-binding IclR family transcriptional regulator